MIINGEHKIKIEEYTYLNGLIMMQAQIDYKLLSPNTFGKLTIFIEFLEKQEGKSMERFKL